ncbi:PREDICTED: ribosome-binding protein 1-like [Nicotiana attenuata]|uniref:ribosome-binding protein 1-like n=1 Tax=Nicotiana attenuata TaxID=49451 RepID=UPI0009046910|nr:PREDICTED: ribosome-binding protein 1-like [Nicotiana attenuata]
MGLRSYMLEIESDRRVETRAKIFLTMLENYRRHRNRCREMHEWLRAGADTRSLGEELEKRDQELMQSIRRCSELEKLLRTKDEELKLGKGVAAECKHLQAKVSSLQDELDQSAARVEILSAEWMGKLSELERKVAELENVENARASALARVAALEDTIRVLEFEQEFERATATQREARLEERIGEIDREASSLGDRIVVLEAEREQFLAQVESASATVPRHLHELWVHAEAQRDIYKGLWEAGNVSEAVYEEARAKAREARVNCGYDPATLEAGEDADVEEFPEDNDEEDGDE